MNEKITVGILFGGKSAEHEVSLQSAKSVVDALDRAKYDLVLIGIEKDGSFFLRDEKNYLINPDNPETIALGHKKEPFIFGVNGSKIDVMFPILHGPFGEDGTVQGLLKLFGIPYVGSDVLGSAVGMDKDVMKRLLRDAEIPISPFLVVHSHERHLWSLEKVLKRIALPFFVKPANLGSSIGISKVVAPDQFEKAIAQAFEYDRKIIIEEHVNGREIQCSLLGNEYPTVSLPCEIIPKGEFHSYASKYIDPEGAELVVPVELTPEELSEVQMTAIKAYQILCCSGMARMDLFLTPKGKVIVNEINTIPGLTEMSPFSKMWEETDLSYPKLLDQLIQFALDRFNKEQQLKIDYEQIAPTSVS